MKHIIGMPAEVAADLQRAFDKVMREEAIQAQALPTEFNEKVRSFIEESKRKGWSDRKIAKVALKEFNIIIQ